LIHVYIWKKKFGEILPGYLIHHINKDKKDNRIENLQMLSFQEHMALHKKLNKERKRKKQEKKTNEKMLL
jgi:hypothetical protein